MMVLASDMAGVMFSSAGILLSNKSVRGIPPSPPCKSSLPAVALPLDTSSESFCACASCSACTFSACRLRSAALPAANSVTSALFASSRMNVANACLAFCRSASATGSFLSMGAFTAASNSVRCLLNASTRVCNSSRYVGSASLAACACSASAAAFCCAARSAAVFFWSSSRFAVARPSAPIAYLPPCNAPKPIALAAIDCGSATHDFSFSRELTASIVFSATRLASGNAAPSSAPIPNVLANPSPPFVIALVTALLPEPINFPPIVASPASANAC